MASAFDELCATQASDDLLQIVLAHLSSHDTSIQKLACTTRQFMAAVEVLRSDQSIEIESTAAEIGHGFLEAITTEQVTSQIGWQQMLRAVRLARSKAVRCGVLTHAPQQAQPMVDLLSP